MGPHGNRRAPLAAPVAFGVAELRPDPARPAGWTLLVDGVAQSYVDLADPAHLEFAYVRRLTAVLRLAAPVSVPLRVLHLGGGGMTLPRLVSATRAGSFQKVVERDGELTALVTRLLPLAAPVEVVVGDARAELEHDEPLGYDVTVVDVFDPPVIFRCARWPRRWPAIRRRDGCCTARSSCLSPLAQSPASMHRPEPSPVG
jgi:hypothetical protein